MEDQCLDGVCQGAPLDGDHDDHVAEGCPGGDDCDDQNGAVHPGAVEGPMGDATCSDGLDNDCDGAPDAADPACSEPLCDDDADCSDHDVCTGTEYCLNGHCQAGFPMLCKDDDPCTEDICHPVFQCLFLPGCCLTPQDRANGWDDPPAGALQFDLAEVTDSNSFVVFTSLATDLGDAVGGAGGTIYRRNRRTGEVVTVSASLNPQVAPDGASMDPSVSKDGRYVAFASRAKNLVFQGTNGLSQIFVRDMRDEETVLVSVGSDGAPANGDCDHPQISDDGQRIVFRSLATNLVANDLNGMADIFVRDLSAGTTRRVNVADSGDQANGPSDDPPAIHPAEPLVAYSSRATNLVPADTNGKADIFITSFAGAIWTQRVSVSTAGAEGNDDSDGRPSFSNQGGFVAFGSRASNLVDGDTAGRDIFVRYWWTPGSTTERVSLRTGGGEQNGDCDSPAISVKDGRYVAFVCSAATTNLDDLLPDTNGQADVFVRDRTGNRTWRVSRPLDGVSEGNQPAFGAQRWPELSDDGKLVAFLSQATNLFPGDENEAADLFVRTNPSDECLDLDPCDLDTCRPEGGCAVGPAPDDTPCPDQSECTQNETCQAGVCQPDVPCAENTPSACLNSVDDDVDGWVDCQDPDCFGVGYCPP